MSDHRADPRPSRFSRKVLMLLLCVNLVILCVADVVQRGVFVWCDDIESAAIASVFCAMISVTPIAVVLILCSWGPGAIWKRSLLLFVTILLYSLLQAAIETTQETLMFDYYFEEVDLSLRIASHMGMGLVITVPMMIVLSMFASIGRWRIGPLKLSSIRIRIIDVMIGTAALAFLFTVNAEIQHQYYSAAQYTEDDFTSFDGQRMQTLLIAGISAPIKAMITAAAAWAAYRWLAALILMVVLLTIAAIGCVIDQGNVQNALGSLAGEFLACGWIAFNIRMIGRGGWPLSRRLSRPPNRADSLSHATSDLPTDIDGSAGSLERDAPARVDGQATFDDAPGASVGDRKIDAAKLDTNADPL